MYINIVYLYINPYKIAIKYLVMSPNPLHPGGGLQGSLVAATAAWPPSHSGMCAAGAFCQQPIQ